MHQFHGFGYAEYNNSLDRRIQVEISREQNHRKGRQLAEQFGE